jgi:hypothetical protein
MYRKEGIMAVKQMEITIKSKFLFPTDRTPDKSIEEIIKGIEALGGKSEIISNKLVKDIPKGE